MQYDKFNEFNKRRDQKKARHIHEGKFKTANGRLFFHGAVLGIAGALFTINPIRTCAETVIHPLSADSCEPFVSGAASDSATDSKAEDKPSSEGWDEESILERWNLDPDDFPAEEAEEDPAVPEELRHFFEEAVYSSVERYHGTLPPVSDLRKYSLRADAIRAAVRCKARSLLKEESEVILDRLNSFAQSFQEDTMPALALELQSRTDPGKMSVSGLGLDSESEKKPGTGSVSAADDLSESTGSTSDDLDGGSGLSSDGLDRSSGSPYDNLDGSTGSTSDDLDGGFSLQTQAAPAAAGKGPFLSILPETDPEEATASMDSESAKNADQTAVSEAPAISEESGTSSMEQGEHPSSAAEILTESAASSAGPADTAAESTARDSRQLRNTDPFQSLPGMSIFRSFLPESANFALADPLTTGSLYFKYFAGGSNNPGEDENNESQEEIGNSPDQPSTGASAPRRIVYIGDSRTVGMQIYVGGDDNEFWSAKNSTGYSWMEKTGTPAVENLIGENTDVVFLMGVNDLGNVYRYVDYMNAKGAEWKERGARTFFVSVTPVVDSKSPNAKNSRIEAFNEYAVNNLQGVHYIDAYSRIRNSFGSPDGIHFDAATYLEIYQIIHFYLYQGWYEEAGLHFYFDCGRPVTGWRLLDGEWQYLDGAGVRWIKNNRVGDVCLAPYPMTGLLDPDAAVLSKTDPADT